MAIASMSPEFADVIVTLHDFNEKTARILPEYIEAIERTIYQELGVAWQADIGQRKSLVEFIQDRGELRELFDERIRQGFFHKFPDYPDMNFPTWQP